MDSDPNTQTKKRTLGQMLTADLLGKLKSKQDFFVSICCCCCILKFSGKLD